MNVARVTVTPIAIQDPPLLNVMGIHQPFALRSIIEVVSDSGLTGIAETYGDTNTLNGLKRVGERVIGMDPFHLNDLWRRVDEGLSGLQVREGQILAPGTLPERARAIVYAAFETAFLDLQGKQMGLPIAEILGGRVRDAVPYSCYLFYKKARHFGADGRTTPYGRAESPRGGGGAGEGASPIAEYGFKSIKLKGGVYEPPEFEIETMRQLKDGLPRTIRCASTPTAAGPCRNGHRGHARAFRHVLEYMEDPVLGFAESAEVARAVDMPIATNMIVVGFNDIPESVRHGSVQVILSDHHYWGGMWETMHLARICKTWGLGLSMHSNSHLGISLAAMTHLAAACPHLTYACDTHYPWQQDEVIKGGKMKFVDGALPVPTVPGLGVEIDPDALAHLHAQYLACESLDRDDVAEMRKHDPSWVGKLPRF